MASSDTRARKLYPARVKREQLMIQCHLRGIRTKVGHYSVHDGVRKWHGPTTLGRMRRKLLAIDVTPIA